MGSSLLIANGRAGNLSSSCTLLTSLSFDEIDPVFMFWDVWMVKLCRYYLCHASFLRWVCHECIPSLPLQFSKIERAISIISLYVKRGNINGIDGSVHVPPLLTFWYHTLMLTQMKSRMALKVACEIEGLHRKFRMMNATYDFRHQLEKIRRDNHNFARAPADCRIRLCNECKSFTTDRTPSLHKSPSCGIQMVRKKSPPSK